jgi:hypothetical protein
MHTRYYRTYQQAVSSLFPFLTDEVAFEERLLCLIEKMDSVGLEAALAAAGSEGSFRNAAWYGLLFAVLASGCQHSDLKSSERVLRTRVFGKLTYRFSVGLVNSNVQSLPASNVSVWQISMAAPLWRSYKPC